MDIDMPSTEGAVNPEALAALTGTAVSTVDIPVRPPVPSAEGALPQLLDGTSSTANSARSSAHEQLLIDRSNKHTLSDNEGGEHIKKRKSGERKSAEYEPHHCGVCGKSHKYRKLFAKDIESHSRVFTTSDGNMYICKWCPCDLFQPCKEMSFDDLVQHIWDQHSLTLEGLIWEPHFPNCSKTQVSEQQVVPTELDNGEGVNHDLPASPIDALSTFDFDFGLANSMDGAYTAQSNLWNSVDAYTNMPMDTSSPMVVG